VQHKLAGMLTEITAMQLYCFRMAQLQEQDRWTGQMASLAKRNHARKGRHICLDARDILGGNGLLLENHVARHPVGATCARVLTTLLYELTRRRARYGLETMCIGGGQGLAAVFERI
jgi:alkylation response protein AidB-like acyl-CoA dehydrogenase